MWKCPKCNREFRKENQSHYCGEKPRSIDEYLLSFDDEIRQQLQLVRDAIHSAIPNAKEKIAWSMPTYWDEHNILHFAGNKKHIGFYPGTEAVNHFSDELDKNGCKYSKGAIQIPYSDHLPLDLISEIAKWCYETGCHA